MQQPRADSAGALADEAARVGPDGARVRRELGIAHIPEDRHRRGLLLEFDLAENSILGVHYRRPIVSYAGVLLDSTAIRKRAEDIIAALKATTIRGRKVPVRRDRDTAR